MEYIDSPTRKFATALCNAARDPARWKHAAAYYQAYKAVMTSPIMTESDARQFLATRIRIDAGRGGRGRVASPEPGTDYRYTASMLMGVFDIMADREAAAMIHRYMKEV